MGVLEKVSLVPNSEAMYADMDELRVIVARQFEDFGINYNPNITAAEIRQAMRTEGIKAEDNEFSCGIIAARGE